MLAHPSVIRVEEVPQNGCHQLLYQQGSLICLLPLQRTLQDQQVDLFQASNCCLFVLGLGASEILPVSIKSRVSVSCSPPALLNMGPAGFQSQEFCELYFLVHDPLAEESHTGLRPLLPCRGKASTIVIFLPFVGH